MPTEVDEREEYRSLVVSSSCRLAYGRTDTVYYFAHIWWRGVHGHFKKSRVGTVIPLDCLPGELMLLLALTLLPGLGLGSLRRLNPRRISVIFDAWRPEMPKFPSLAPSTLANRFISLIVWNARKTTHS